MANYPAGGKVYPPKAEFFGDNGKMEAVGDNARKGTSAGKIPDCVFPVASVGDISNS